MNKARRSRQSKEGKAKKAKRRRQGELGLVKMTKEGWSVEHIAMHEVARVKEQSSGDLAVIWRELRPANWAGGLREQQCGTTLARNLDSFRQQFTRLLERPPTN